MTAKLRLELPLLLPEIDGAADACVTRLVESLSAREGVRNAHIVAAAGEDSAKLCVHYDPDLLSLPRIREIAQSEGAKITERFGHLLWNVDGLSNQRRARTVAGRLLRAPGIVEADASAAGVVRIDFDRDKISEVEIERLLGKLGVYASARRYGWT